MYPTKYFLQFGIRAKKRYYIRVRFFPLTEAYLLSTHTIEYVHVKPVNLQYNTVERWVEETIVPPSDGPMFILIDWE